MTNHNDSLEEINSLNNLTWVTEIRGNQDTDPGKDISRMIYYVV
jgi:hypothetical protein